MPWHFLRPSLFVGKVLSLSSGPNDHSRIGSCSVLAAFFGEDNKLDCQIAWRFDRWHGGRRESVSVLIGDPGFDFLPFCVDIFRQLHSLKFWLILFT